MHGRIPVAPGLSLDLGEVEFHPIRAQGPGGQHTNKAATAVQLRYDLRRATLPDELKARLLALHDQRISRDGVVVIKAQTRRSQAQNREEAIRRLLELIRRALEVSPPRRWTRPSRRVRHRRLERKAHRAALKRLRRRVELE